MSIGIWDRVYHCFHNCVYGRVCRRVRASTRARVADLSDRRIWARVLDPVLDRVENRTIDEVNR
jgi:hypothetical protein